jgi:prepilin-type N-terminal cleavage/methylation domain-containing protein
MARPTRHAGFTLTELMVTLAVLAILVGISIPSVLAWMPSIYLKDGAVDVKSAMIRARSLAINEGVEHRVSFDPYGAAYQVDRGNLTSGSTTWTPVLGPLTLPPGINIKTVSAAMEADGANPFLRFSVGGAVVTNLDQLSVTLVNDDTDTYRVDVQRRTGHTSLVKGG